MRLNNIEGDDFFRPESGVGLPYLTRYDNKINKKLKILIDTGATFCYIRTGIYKNKNELPIYKRVSTGNGYSIIKYYRMVTIFDTRYTFYEIDGLKSDFLIGYNLLKKIGAVIDTEKGVKRHGGKKEKLIYDNDSSFNQISLSEEETILL